MHVFLLSFLIVISLWPLSVQADIHDEFRSCRYEVFPKFRKMKVPTASTPVEQFCLGFAYWREEGHVKRDPVRSAQWFSKAAEQGHPGAQTVLGYHYEQGHGVKKDAAEALKWIRKAVDQGYPDAMFHLGRLYTTGKGVKASPGEARAWFQKAAKGGSVDGAVALRKEREWEVEQPARAQFEQADAAYRAKDSERAAMLYRTAAKAGNVAAQVALATLLRTGQGITKDVPEALKLVRRAADDGYARAQAQLGFMYEYGEGLKENWSEAAKWCIKSGQQYDKLGLYCLGRLYQFGIGVPQDRAKAIAAFDLAEDQGDGQSKYFAWWLRTAQNCIGYRDEAERTRYLGVCGDPKGMTFVSSHERHQWMNQKLAELAALADALRRSMSDYGKGACGAAGGSWGGGGCTGEGGRTFDPGQQDRYGRPLW